ncbi:MAG: VWA domain-containing protein [Paracoccaceae bacterium]
MSFVAPFSFLLLLPLLGFLFVVRSGGSGQARRLPGAWHGLVQPALRGDLAARSRLGQAVVPVLCFIAATLVITALARPGVDTDDTDRLATLAGRVIILDVGAALARHRHFMDALHSADGGIATAVIAASGDAYRIVPFTTDKSQIDRYVQVLDAGMIPRQGQSPHIALATAERILTDAGYLVRQIVLLSARGGPQETVEIPLGQSRRIVVPLGDTDRWDDWAAAEHAEIAGPAAARDLTERLKQDARAMAHAELPSTRHEFTTVLIALAALIWLLLFRRREA